MVTLSGLLGCFVSQADLCEASQDPACHEATGQEQGGETGIAADDDPLFNSLVFAANGKSQPQASDLSCFSPGEPWLLSEPDASCQAIRSLAQTVPQPGVGAWGQRTGS